MKYILIHFSNTKHIIKKTMALTCILYTVNSLSTIEKNDLQKLNIYSQAAYSTKKTLYNSFELAVSCLENNIPGDLVECGVAAGAQVAAMGLACLKLDPSRTIHLFDSFEGIPLAGPNDDQQPGIGKITHNVNVDLNSLLVTSGITAHSIAQVKSFLQRCGIPSQMLKYHKGWFQNVLPQDSKSIDKICLLRLDGDLYESTKICLEYLYPKISAGGYIIIDDYALTGCRKAVREYIEANNLDVSIIPIDGNSGPVYWQIK